MAGCREQQLALELLDLETSAGKAAYSDSFYACEGQPGEVFVDNIDELENVTYELLPK